ncbi:lytic transglycosylase domain-containing protein [Alkalihalobacillus sp. CinArs1]|uniref:lytic transglycosylase domain-containing protein n=1 Tax=Alkalihalobacillus sp. CinArs1 TaxID=2995314 RepID=UPI0022DE5428|nr:lytic transglycosylase domain-containing protein [Alkalihalobacillus sp. CinArs1]
MKRPARLIITTIIASVIIALFLQGNSEPFRFQLSKSHIPEEYVDTYKKAAEEYDIQWELLAAVHRVETKFSTMASLESPKGAIGHYQFMPRTWLGWQYEGSALGKLNAGDDIDITDPALINKYGGYGKDGNGDGKADPYNITDAAFTAASYLSANGASEGKLETALYAYNHSDEYVDDVLSYYYEYKENATVVTLNE